MLFRFVKRWISQVYTFLYWWIKSYKKKLIIDSLDISRDCYFEGENQVRRGVSIGPNCSLGKRSYISGPNTTINSAKIGKYCSIAMGVKLGLDEHNYTKVSTHPFLYSTKFGNFTSKKNSTQVKGPVLIEDDVWIGCNAVVLRGVKIGKGAVIAAGCVVTKDVAPYTIVGGVPAKLLGYRFSDIIRSELFLIDWCSWSDSKISNVIEKFNEPDVFISDFKKKYSS